jgi:endoglucanase
VYIDAGGPGWIPASVMAARLKAAGVGQSRGFSVNVSSFNADTADLAYGDAVSKILGGSHFIVDTSRNGLGAGSTWCNPAGRALGKRFTAVTGDPLADAFTWIKGPGDSDGQCNGGPAAGVFWVPYAVGLGARAQF